MSQMIETRTRKRCAVYCRVSTDERLNQEFNSIDAQKEAGQAYIVSQRAEGWIPVADDYDDGGFSGGTAASLKETSAPSLLPIQLRCISLMLSDQSRSSRSYKRRSA